MVKLKPTPASSDRSGGCIRRTPANGGTIVRSPTPGPVLFVDAWYNDAEGKPVAGVEVDIWQSSTEGFYENQDPVQADMNLRGKFMTDDNGHIGFRSREARRLSDPDRRSGRRMCRALRRHNMRPAHLHFLAYKPGLKPLISQIYDPEDPYLETDVQFGVTRTSDRQYHPPR